MQLRLGHFLCGKSLIRLICALAVAMASILHVDTTFAASPVSSGIQCFASQDDDPATDHQVVGERCHFCAVTAFADVAFPAAREPGSPIVPSGRTCRLVDFELPITAPPPRS